jgi:hypothetical protein
MAEYIANEAVENYVAPVTSDAGNEFCVYGSVSVGAPAVGDTIKLVLLPRGAKITRALVKSASSSSGGKFKLGTASDDDSLGTGFNLDGTVQKYEDIPVAISTSADEILTATVTNAGTASAGTVTGVVWYILTNIVD